MAAIADDEAGVRMALEVCGACDEQQDAIVAEGFENMSDLTVMEEKDITDMMTNITRLPVNRGRVRNGAVVTKMVKALVYWCKEQRRRGENLDANRFTE
jgi:hypothetical protein